jgi:hypothetical protein
MTTTSRRRVNPRISNAADLARIGLNDYQISRLQEIARSLSRISERWCNEEMTDTTTARLEARESRLEAEATTIAAAVGLLVYVQGDPRGWPLYLYKETHPRFHEPDHEGKYLPIASVYNMIGTGVCSE